MQGKKYVEYDVRVGEGGVQFRIWPMSIKWNAHKRYVAQLFTWSGLDVYK